MRRHELGVFERVAGFEVGGDPGRPESWQPILTLMPRLGGAPLDGLATGLQCLDIGGDSGSPAAAIMAGTAIAARTDPTGFDPRRTVVPLRHGVGASPAWAAISRRNEGLRP